MAKRTKTAVDEFMQGGSNVGILGDGALDGMLKNANMPSIGKDFVHPGKTPEELLMRCIFKDEREANAAVIFLAKCEKFHLERKKKMLLNKLAASVSVNGISRKELLQVLSRIVVPALYGKAGAKTNSGNKDEV